MFKFGILLNLSYSKDHKRDNNEVARLILNYQNLTLQILLRLWKLYL